MTLATLFLLYLLMLAVQIWALVDAARQPDGALDGGKTVWVVLLAVFLVVPGGVILSIVYLCFIRPRRPVWR